jgi:hypothetical protein
MTRSAPSHPPRPDGLEPREHARLAACSGCGACDAQLGPEDGWDRALVGPPSRWVTRLAQAPGRWPELLVAIAHLPEARAEAMEARCHAHVPFARLRARAHGERPRPGPKKKRIHDPG